MGFRNAADDGVNPLRAVPPVEATHYSPSKHDSGNMEMLGGFGATVLAFAIMFAILIATGVVKPNKGHQDAANSKTPAAHTTPASQGTPADTTK